MDLLAKALNQFVNNLSNRISTLSSTSGAKTYLLYMFSDTDLDKLDNLLFQYHLYFCANLAQFIFNITKINLTITYLTGIA